ncbi:MAG: type VII toxin-antitoxin system HepT family RNase toxin [Bacillota bacterium]
MIDDIILNKSETVERCIARIDEEYQNDPNNLENYTKQDSIILNLQRLCEAAIDLAMHLISELDLGIPQTSREAFSILEHEEIIDSELAENLKAMVGFRNIAVHDYQKINLEIVQAIIENNLADIVKFVEVIKETD